MKKVRGKALALVLSIALVVSSFSTAFSSAASRSEKATGIASGAIDDLALVNGGANDAARSVEISPTADLTTEKHETVTGANLTALSRASGSDLLKWTLHKDEDGVVDKATLTLRSGSDDGTETIKALYKARVTDDEDNVTTYTYTDEFTVTVFDKGSVVIGEAKAHADGTDATLSTDFAQKTLASILDSDTGARDSKTLSVYQAQLASEATDAKVHWVALDIDANEVAETSTAQYVVKTSNGLTLAKDESDATKFTATVEAGASVGNVSITAERIGTDDDYPTKKATAKTKITKTLKVDLSAAAEKPYVDFIKAGGTYLATDTEGTAKVLVTGYEVNFANPTASTESAAGTQVLVVERASVEKISGSVNELKIAGSTSTVSVTGDVTVTGSKAKGGDITATGDVTVEDGATAKDISATGDVAVSNATVGKISADGTISVTADEEDASVKTGDIVAKQSVTLTASDEESAKLSVGTLTAAADEVEFDISGNVTIGGADFDYYESTLSFNDFQGKVPAPKNVKDGAASIITNDPDDNVEVTGDATFSSVTVTDESTIKFDGKATINDLDGPGSVVVKAGSLKIVDGIYSAILKLSDDPIVPGTKIFTADAGAVDVDDFTPYGYTVKVNEGDDTDTFLVDKLQFVGLKIAGNGRIVKDSKATFTVSAYPTGSAIPEGLTVDWSVDNTDKFTATPNADGSVTVEAANFDEDFASENKGVLTATLVDDEGYEYDEDYEPGTLDLTEIKVPDTTYKSDTTGNVALGLGQTYQFKITSLDGKPVTFAVASNGATVTLANASGNDYYYKVTGAKVGNYGVYVNADKTPVAVLNITSNVKIDTTTVTIASGRTYQFKVTAPAQPTFQVAGLGTIALAQKTGNDYFYKVTANNVKGGHGVYVNGVRLAIATFA